MLNTNQLSNEEVLLNSNEYPIAQSGEPIVNITDATARQKVSGYVGDQISHLMGGGEPALVLTRDALVWRVPLILTTPSQGIVGVVGSLDVDAHTGSLIIPPDFREQVETNAQKVSFASEELAGSLGQGTWDEYDPDLDWK